MSWIEIAWYYCLSWWSMAWCNVMKLACSRAMLWYDQVQHKSVTRPICWLAHTCLCAVTNVRSASVKRPPKFSDCHVWYTLWIDQVPCFHWEWKKFFTPPPLTSSHFTPSSCSYTHAHRTHVYNFSYTCRIWSWLGRTPLQLFLPGLTRDTCFLLLIWVKSYPYPMSQWPLITLFHVVIQFDRETDPANFREPDCLGHQTLYRGHEPNPTYSPSLEEKVRCSLAYN